MRRFGRGQIVLGFKLRQRRRLRVETQFYDTLETRDPAEREAALTSALPQIIAAAKERALVSDSSASLAFSIDAAESATARTLPRCFLL